MSMYRFVSHDIGLNLHIFSAATISPSGIEKSSVKPKILSVGDKVFQEYPRNLHYLFAGHI